MNRLRNRLARAGRWAALNARGLLAAAAFLALAAGCWMAWPPAGLIVPGALVLAGLVWSHIRGEGGEE